MDSINRLQSIWTGLARNNYAAYVDEHDISSFIRRSGSEGPEFYARCLTALRSDLLAGLETGSLLVKSRFGKKRGTSLPRFMYGAWSKVFTDDGQLRDTKKPQYLSKPPSGEPTKAKAERDFFNDWLKGEYNEEVVRIGVYDAGAVSCLNQLTAVFGKIIGGHTPESEIACLHGFVRREEEMRAFELDMMQTVYGTRRELYSILHQASTKIRRVLSKVSPSEIAPSHGSGVSACDTLIRDRYRLPRFIPKLDELWPMVDYYFANYAHFCEQMEEFQNTEVYDPVAKVLLVPKDARGPRLICCEPRETMFVQQGLMSLLYKTIESNPMTRRSVNFTDQTHNQRAALRSSKDGRYATLDLSEASDRLRMDVVEMLFPPNWRQALNACRSSQCRMPDGTVVDLIKHAPMGSAVCFPVMALVIWAVLSATLPQNTRILVYGDDIVVPSEWAETSTLVLEAIGFKVNTSKSYSKGPFRESCGVEAISGLDITPVRLRAIPENDCGSRARTIAFANNMFAKHGKELSWLTKLIHEWYDDVPERSHDPHRGEILAQEILNGQLFEGVKYRTVCDKTLGSVLNVWQANNSHLRRRRWNLKLQRFEFRILTVEPLEDKYSTDDWCHLFRALVNPRARKAFGVDALSKRVRYKYRWTAWLS